MGEFYEYLWALAGYGKWLVTGGPYLVENIVKRLQPNWITWLDTKISPQLRYRAEIGVILIAIFFAGFLAWRDEHEARLHAEANIHNSVDENQKHLAMKNLLSTVINEGGALQKDWFKRTDADAFLHETNIWTNKTGHLIEDAYGKGEASVWMSDANLVCRSAQTDERNE